MYYQKMRKKKIYQTTTLVYFIQGKTWTAHNWYITETEPKRKRWKRQRDREILKMRQTERKKEKQRDREAEREREREFHNKSKHDKTGMGMKTAIPSATATSRDGEWQRTLSWTSCWNIHVYSTNTSSPHSILPFSSSPGLDQTFNNSKGHTGSQPHHVNKSPCQLVLISVSKQSSERLSINPSTLQWITGTHL